MNANEMNTSNEEIKFDIESIANLEIFKQNSKLFLRLKLNVEQNNFYEAHQAYKTLHFRCMSLNRFEDALDLIYNGICYFLENNQIHCGFDLSKVYVDTLKKVSKLTLNDKLINRISHIHRLLRSSIEERSEFTVTILKWSSIFNNSNNENQMKNTQFGHPDIHREFAITLWKEQNYPQSRYHFLRSYDGESCASMLIEFHLKCGYPSEVDLFVAQTVLQYLCLKNKRTANVVFEKYTKMHPNISKGPPYMLPLLNFIWLLLVAVDIGKLALYTALCEKYKVNITRDPSYKDYLDNIGQIFFNLKLKNSGQENTLNSILRMFISDSDTNSTSNNKKNPFMNINDDDGDDDDDDDGMDSFVDLDDNDELD